MPWQTGQSLQHRIHPAPLKNWLLDRGSLTGRLLEKSGGAFRVRVLRQQWGIARRDEVRLLDINPRHRVLIREVILYGREEPWVYARSILPAKSLDHSLRYLKRIGNKPLGAVLFSDPYMQRSEIHIARLAPEQLPVVVDAAVWGRRSVFFLRHQPLLVSEIFLPAFVKRL